MSTDPAPFCRTQRTWAIFLISVAGLFLQLMLIRWIGTEVRIFAYLQNTILVVCFLGMGYGCFTAKRDPRLLNLLVALIILVGLLAVPAARQELARISEFLSVLSDLVIWEQSVARDMQTTILRLTFGLAMTAGLMLLILETAIPVGRILGRLMDEHPNTILAYSVNIAGSLAGVWLFVLLSVFYQPPFMWMVIALACVLPFLGEPVWPGMLRSVLLVMLLVASWFASVDPEALAVYWSPYQKLVLLENRPDGNWPGQYRITVNNASYQALIDLRPEATLADSSRFPPNMRGYSQYDLPARLHPDAKSMLIVGAGGGNDAAGALRQGVAHVTAVEIDPAIVEIGRHFHPERPYESPDVTVVNDDARSYFATCRERFDVIVFGLLDSHTTTAMTNARLDHYVYTVEALRQAQTLLKPGGVLVLSFEARKRFIADRMARALREIFGEPPIVFRVPFTGYGWGGVMFIAGDVAGVQARIAGDERLSRLIQRWQRIAPITLAYQASTITDDWPYVYLEQRRIPTLYFLLGGLLAVLLLRCFRILPVAGGITYGSGANWHFCFLGAAFLLLEVQNISKASVALGNTWLVNAVIISGVLVMILLANAVAAAAPRLPLLPVYALLIGASIVLYFVDISRFAFLPYATKALLVGGLTTLPMLFSGIIFVRSLAGVQHKDAALGANMIGALAGGLLQSVTFITGIKALLLIVAGLYLLAFLTRPRAAGAVVAASAGAPLVAQPSPTG